MNSPCETDPVRTDFGVAMPKPWATSCALPTADIETEMAIAIVWINGEPQAVIYNPLTENPLDAPPNALVDDQGALLADETGAILVFGE